ncbi:MAG: MtrAB system histidine kinase MtrB, partial [Actinomycetota bacterium]|nr:MtrAB system histidine kinase MtrB [Actinomycetota bacterium]
MRAAFPPVPPALTETGLLRRSWRGAGRALARRPALPPSILAAARRPVYVALRTWRRSLRLRVVTTTVVLSLLVLAVLGTFLLNRVQSGLLAAKEDAALAEAGSGTREAQSTFDAANRTGGATSSAALVEQVVQSLSTAGGEAGSNEVLLVRITPGSSAPVGVRAAVVQGRQPEAIPPALQEAVQSSAREQHWTYTTMQGGDGRKVPALAVGSRVYLPTVTAHYGLYYLFPLDKEAETLALVQRALAVAAGMLLALVGLIAFVVTRQVVTPVRMAARIAERLSAGRLEERMHVRGEDDLARLAASFNKMATSLQRQIRQLEDLSRVQRRFVSDVSHELRTPLTTVRMAADVLFEERDRFDPAAARSAELLQAQLDRFEVLLADLLEISRYDAGAAQLEAEPYDICEVVHHVVEATHPLAEARRTEVSVEVPDEPCVAEVDNRRVERIVRNLVVNAIEHGEGRPVCVRVRCDDDAVAIGVRDHGVGLRPGESALVFNRFWRADPARARTTGGTGLGLSIALEDAHLHGGWLQAWGEPGLGAHFRVTLPRRAGEALHGSPIALEPADSARRLERPAIGTPYRRTNDDA